ncbi:DUF3306 domain-containing protein [Roseomonas marmotae]|uniref:DUF3306 domain-containing protein n=1 Tax=Roseomonas marmotae TaxID=2768161 RepID=A0ABS3KCC2_9PROT|nr:DUF3306 domain-containing protein [Roseomonas marmotae]MBO1075112.1 DUF3306 domain-containing protein [Roseomonas marmotae]QTI79773.1 DUF3306 domain-containing protein [Roseomonas marmotae]
MSGSFLGRWSRRKRGLEQEQEPQPAEPAPAVSVEAGPVEAGPAETEPEFDPATLPPLESLDRGGDLSPFLHPKVPALLRRAAMRRVWASDPGIRDFTGPADYAWDYNAPDGVPGFALDLGKADLRKLLAQAVGDREPEPEPEPGSEAGEAPAAPRLEMAEEQTPPPLTEAPLPEDPVRLSEAPTEAPAGLPAEAASPEPEEAPRRRHGGAMPRPG